MITHRQLLDRAAACRHSAMVPYLGNNGRLTGSYRCRLAPRPPEGGFVLCRRGVEHAGGAMECTEFAPFAAPPLTPVQRMLVVKSRQVGWNATVRRILRERRRP